LPVQQAPRLTRPGLQRHDLSVSGREVIQNRVDIGPETPFVSHSISAKRSSRSSRGSLDYHTAGELPKTFDADEDLLVAAE
jgi:hypothetical protein